jgi:uncharacterized RDD family membrane protein YckC
MARRLLSWWWDYVVILGWLLLLFLVIGLPQLLGWWDLASIWSSPLGTDVAITLLTVLPWYLYLVVTESGSRHATWGKRRAGLRVTGEGGTEPGLGAILGRNLIKVLPWQLGHMGTVRLVTMETPPPFAIWLDIGSLVPLALIVVPVLFGRRGIHDLIAGTDVVPTS